MLWQVEMCICLSHCNSPEMQISSTQQLFWHWRIVVFLVFWLFWTLIACQPRNAARQRGMARCPSLWLKDYFIKSFWMMCFNFYCSMALESELLRKKGLRLLEVPGVIWGEMRVVAKACVSGFSPWFSQCGVAQRHRNNRGEMLGGSCESPKKHSFKRQGRKANWFSTDKLPHSVFLKMIYKICRIWFTIFIHETILLIFSSFSWGGRDGKSISSIVSSLSVEGIL